MSSDRPFLLAVTALLLLYLAVGTRILRMLEARRAARAAIERQQLRHRLVDIRQARRTRRRAVKDVRAATNTIPPDRYRHG